VGDKIAFVVPEDRIRVLSEEDTKLENSVSASVIGEEFVGATLRLYAEAVAHQEIRLLTTYDSRSSAFVGTSHRVALSWNTSDAYVLPE
jgi:spermidine/putrescine transport system ATP-binding protein